MLEIQNLNYQVNGKTLVRDFNFHLKSGQVVALLGPNGAGKSTLIKLISGELTPDSGEILINHHPLSAYTPRKLALQRAVMAQNNPIPFRFTAYEIVMMGRYPHGGKKSREDEHIVRAAMSQTETEHLAEQFFSTLSGGEASRVTLARILAQQAPFVMLDEATAALDLRHRQSLMSLARELAAQGSTLLLTLHDLNLATYADQIALIRDGALIAYGTPAEVLTAANIETVFDLPVMVTEHPLGHGPLVIPLPLNA